MAARTSKSTSEEGGPEVRSMNRWLVIAGWTVAFFATTSCSLLAWMAMSINGLGKDVVAIRTELNLVKPADVLEAVRKSESRQLRPQDVEQIVNRTAPWLEDQPEWLQWRMGITDRVRSLELNTVSK